MDKTYLYIKKHTGSGLKYLGKTQKNDPFKYKGSGKYWNSFLKKHGYDIETIWVSDPFYDEQDIQELALFLSEFFDIVNSKEWANLKNENGIDGNPKGFGNMNLGTKENSLNGLKYAVLKNKGKKRPEHARYMREYWKKNPDKLKIPIRENFKHTDKTKKLLSDSAKNRPIISCIKCHKTNTLSKGIFTCHFYNHHKDCNPYV